ncbi:MAG: hypothetical protein WC663_02625 [Patescibacteria group bacterium]|jgi:hypothetical protein
MPNPKLFRENVLANIDACCQKGFSLSLARPDDKSYLSIRLDYLIAQCELLEGSAMNADEMKSTIHALLQASIKIVIDSGSRSFGILGCRIIESCIYRLQNRLATL